MSVDDYYKVNPIRWYSNRELDFKPAHFIESNVPLTKESLVWVREKLLGRYFLDDKKAYPFLPFIVNTVGVIYFEDPKELSIYELTWG